MQDDLKIKLIFSDVDGTLIDDAMVLSEANIRAVREFKRRGGQFVICTGRLAESVDGYVEQLGLSDQPITAIGLQGALVKTASGGILSCERMAADTALSIVEYAVRTGTYCHIYDEKNVYIKEFDQINIDYRSFTGAPLHVVGDLAEYMKQTRFSPTKIMMVIQRGSSKRYFDDLAAMNLGGIKTMMSSATYFEVLPEKAGKGEGIRRAAQFLGIDLSETIAVGDNMNDIEMIETAGIGVAVKNAIPALKSVADHVLDVDNNHNAIAALIERFCG